MIRETIGKGSTRKYSFRQRKFALNPSGDLRRGVNCLPPAKAGREVWPLEPRLAPVAGARRFDPGSGSILGPVFDSTAEPSYQTWKFQIESPLLSGCPLWTIRFPSVSWALPGARESLQLVEPMECPWFKVCSQTAEKYRSCRPHSWFKLCKHTGKRSEEEA